MNESLVTLIVLAALVVGVIIRKAMNWGVRRELRGAEALDFLRDEGLEQFADRLLHNTRIVRYRGTREGCVTLVESGSGAGVRYARVDYEFPRELTLGVRISSEREEGLLTRVMRLREVEIGFEHFDSMFILLSRNEDRLRGLLDRRVRKKLLQLHERVKDVRLNDRGLHLQVIGEITREDFLTTFALGAELAGMTFERAVEILEGDKHPDVDDSLPAFTPIPGALRSPERTTDKESEE